MLAKISLAISFLFAMNCLAANVASNIDPFSKQNEKLKKNAERIINAVVNKKTYEELSDEQRMFIDNYEIDLSRPVKSIYFANLVKDLHGENVLGQNVVGISYFDGSVDKASLEANRNQSQSFSDGHQNYEGFSGFEFKIKKPRPQVTPSHHVSAQVPMPAAPTIQISHGPGQIFKNGKLIRFGCNEVLINDEVYTCEEASIKLGYPVKPVSLAGINIVFH